MKQIKQFFLGGESPTLIRLLLIYSDQINQFPESNRYHIACRMCDRYRYKGKDIARNLGKKYLDTLIIDGLIDRLIDRFNKEYITGSRRTLTNNEIKDIIKVINSLENREFY